MYNATKFKDSRFYPYKLITAFLHISNIKYIKINSINKSNQIDKIKKRKRIQNAP